MQRQRHALVALALSGALGACLGSVSGPPDDPTGCTPYATRDCQCTTGETGQQRCRSDRVWGDCICEGSGEHDLLCSAGACLDEDSGLYWQQSPSGQVLTWAEARYYCGELVLDAEEDWRLPVLDELRTLVRECPASQPGGDCEASDACLEPRCEAGCTGCPWNQGPGDDGCYWPPELHGNCWSYWSRSNLAGSVTDAWLVVFDGAKLEFKATDDLGQVRCVRKP